ncbi:hypothetical protein [Haladaptatus sp. NG-WS-4]
MPDNQQQTTTNRIDRRSILKYGALATGGTALTASSGIGAAQQGNQSGSPDVLPVYMLDSQIYQEEYEVVSGPLQDDPPVTSENGNPIDLSSHDTFVAKYNDGVNSLAFLFPHQDAGFEVGETYELAEMSRQETRVVNQWSKRVTQQGPGGASVSNKRTQNKEKYRKGSDGGSGGGDINPSSIFPVFPLPVSP